MVEKSNREEGYELSEFWSVAVPKDARHIVIHMRNADDIQALIAENNRLREQVKSLQRDIYSWTTIHAKYMEALDDLRELREICRANGIQFDFRSL